MQMNVDCFLTPVNIRTVVQEEKDGQAGKQCDQCSFHGRTEKRIVGLTLVA